LNPGSPAPEAYTLLVRAVRCLNPGWATDPRSTESVPTHINIVMLGVDEFLA